MEPGTALLSSALLDSMGLIELIAGIQNEFGITLDLADLRRETFDTPELMVQFILRG